MNSHRGKIWQFISEEKNFYQSKKYFFKHIRIKNLITNKNISKNINNSQKKSLLYHKKGTQYLFKKLHI